MGVRLTAEGVHSVQAAQSRLTDHDGRIASKTWVARQANVHYRTYDRFLKRQQPIDETLARSILRVLELENRWDEIIESTTQKKLAQTEHDFQVEQTPTFPSLDWVCASRLMLKQQIERERELRRNITAMAAEVDVFVPLGLVQPKEKTTARKREDNLSPEGEMGMSQLNSEEITKRFNHDEFLQEIVYSWQKNLVIVGEPGAGKSTWMTRIAHFLVEQKELVICIPLGSSIISDHQSIDQVVTEKWIDSVIKIARKDNDKNKEDTFTELKEINKPIWLLLDGIDEIPDVRDPINRIRDLLKDSWLGQNSRIILSCRINVWQNNLYTLPEFNTFRTIGFNQEQVIEFVGQWFSSAKVNQESKGKQLKERLTEADLKGERIAELVKNPLRLAMVCQSWYFNQGTLPETKADLYQSMRRNFYEWKRDKFPLTQEQITELNRALSQVALKSIETSQPISASMAYQEMGEKQFELAKKMGWINQTHIDRSSQETFYGFYHYSFKEFFAAEGIQDWDFFFPRNHDGKPAKDAQGYIKPYRIFDKRWKEVVLLWLGRSDIPESEKKAFLGMKERDEEPATGLALMIEHLGGFGDGCEGVYEQKAIEWQLRSTSQINQFLEDASKYLAGIPLETLLQFEDFHLLPKTLLDSAITEFFQSLSSLELVNYTRELIIHKFHPFAQRNQTAIDVLCNIIANNDEEESIRTLSAIYLGKIDNRNSKAINSLTQVLLDCEDDEERYNYTMMLMLDLTQLSYSSINALIQTILNNKNITKESISEVIALGKFSDPKTINTLIQVLMNDENPVELRNSAAVLLGEFSNGDPMAMETLIHTLDNHENPVELRNSTAVLLGEFSNGDPMVMETLIRTLDNHENIAELRSSAANALGKFDDVRAIDSLIKALTDDQTTDEIYENVIQSLGKIAQGNDKAIDALSQTFLNHQISDEIRVNAAYALVNICEGDSQAIHLVFQALIDDQIFDRIRRHTNTLNKARDPRTIDVLTQTLLNAQTSDEIRKDAANTLGKIAEGDPRTIDVLTQAILNDEISDNVRKDAFNALGEIANEDPRTIDVLTQVLLNAQTSDEIRKDASNTLGKIANEDPGTIDVLTQALNDEVSDIARKTITDVLYILKSPRSVNLVKTEPRRKIVNILNKIGLERTLDVLIQSLLNNEMFDEDCQSVVDALMIISDTDKSMFNSKIDSDDTPRDKVRKTFTSSLSKSGDSGAINVLIQFLINEQNAVRPRIQAAYLLGMIGDPKVIDVLVQILINEKNAVKLRKQAADSLGMIGDPKVIDMLIQIHKC